MPLNRVNSVASVAAAILFLVLGWTGAAWAEGYVTGADDLPLMAGLNEVPGGALVFDSPGGRIVEAQALGSLSLTQVTAFYNSALPQLGWVAKEQSDEVSVYVREDEILAIHLGVSDDESTVVNFTISPRSTDSDALGSH